MTKQELRTYWLKHRLTLSEPEKNNRSFQIQEFLFNEIPVHTAHSIHIFLPVHEKCEVRTWSIIQYILEKYPRVNVCVPKVTDFSNRKMASIRIEPNTIFVRNKWGIEEPESGPEIRPDEIDIIFLPLIVFDKTGHRLGYGGGFYDRYLPLCLNAKRIGLSYFDPVDSIPEINEFDVPMDFCITPDKIWHF